MSSRPRTGFTLIEVLVALGILALGTVAIVSLHLNNLRTARQTKDELTLALLMQELRTRTQLLAYTAANATGSTFESSSWLLHDDATPDTSDEPPEALDALGYDDSARRRAFNEQAWSAIKAKFDALSAPGSTWDKHPLYGTWQFRMRTRSAAEAENNQFVDWDGYDIWDSQQRLHRPNIHDDEVLTGEASTDPAHRPLEIPKANRAAPPAGATNEGYFGPPRSSHGVVFDPRGLRQFAKRVECVIGWDLADSKDIFSGQYHVFVFTVYNPDARKRP